MAVQLHAPFLRLTSRKMVSTFLDGTLISLHEILIAVISQKAKDEELFCEAGLGGGGGVYMWAYV